METQSEVGSWDNYIKNFLKVEDVENETDGFVCISVEEVEFDGDKSLRLRLDRDPNKYLFDLNKTNASFIKTSGIKSPKDIVGKILYFKKVKVFNPQTKKEVDGLRILKIE